MTEVHQQDARLIEMDAAMVAAIRVHAPELEAAYLADDLPFWFESLLDNCAASAEHIADEHWDDRAFIEAFARALPKLLDHARALKRAGLATNLAVVSFLHGSTRSFRSP